MSEEGGFIDVESDEVPELGGEATASSSGHNNDHLEYHTDKRAHHNLLERRRRDHIKDSFHGLRDCIPSLQGEKVSRAHILNKATEYIRQMQRGGSMRESEIVDLKKKNEVLEEQVRAIEQNKALGSEQKIEEVLEAVAKQVQQKQKQRETFQDKAVQGASKSDKAVGELGGRDLTRSFTMATRNTPTTVGSGTDPSKCATSTQSSTATTSALNLLHLAGNLKNAQALLSVLQKNLPQNATLANVKSLASKALSAPPRQGQANAASSSSSLPRGIVTATTVPKGSALPPNLASALQQKPSGTTTASPVLVGGKTSQLANHLTSQLKPTTATPTSSGTGVASKTSQTSSENGSVISEENGLLQNSNKSTAAQVLEASTLLQQQGGGDIGGAAGSIPSLTAELIAQCFLNLPNNISMASGSSNKDGEEERESVTMTTDATVSAANVLAALGSLSPGTTNHHLTSPSPTAVTSHTSHPPTFTTSPLPTSLSSPPTADPQGNTDETTPPVAKKQKLEPQL